MVIEEGLGGLSEVVGSIADHVELPDELPDELPEEMPEGMKPAGCLTRLLPVTTPGCATWLTAIFMVVTVITVWSFFWLDPDHVPWRHSISLPRIALIGLLLLVIPFVVNRLLKLWLEGSPSPFPDLDYAWEEGLHALASNGLAIQSLPIFLIIGSRSEQQERAIMNAAGLRLRVAGVPEGPSALHWYANSEAIYLFCSDCAWSSAIASLREDLAAEAMARGIDGTDPGNVALSDSLYASVPPPEVNPVTPPTPVPQATQNYAGNYGNPNAPYALPTSSLPQGSAEPIRGTIMLDQYMPSAGSPASQSPSNPSASPYTPLPPSSSRSSDDDAMRGTLLLDEQRGSANRRTAVPGFDPPNVPYGQSPSGIPSPAMSSAPMASIPATPPESEQSGTYRVSRPEVVTHEPVLVAPQYSSASLQELQYLGQKLRRARQSVCPINGILTLIQFESIHSTPAELEELQKAIRSDLATIRYAFGLRAPVTAMIVGLEKERGFRELVRRVGRERAVAQRFGRKFDVEAVPTEQEMRALTAHVCGAFEDWAYTLFREEQSLSRPGNTRLYELLSRVRCSWKQRLAEILVGGFGCEAGKGAQEDSVLFSGCYFAATGDTPDRQAFVKGVVDKLSDEQEMIEWTREALRTNRRQNRWALAGVIGCVLLLLSLLFMILYNRYVG